MALHGLTRVTMVGDKVVVVAGPVPAHIIEQTVSMVDEVTPMTARHLVPLVEAVPIQASKQKENDSGS